MVRAGGLILVACVGLSPTATLAWQLQAAVCGADGHFDPAALVNPEGETCGGAMTQYFGHIANRTSFTEAECSSQLNAEITIGAAFVWTGTRCCTPTPRTGPCGVVFAPEQICATAEEFMPDNEFDQHCNGDEDQPEEVCMLAGEGAWNPAEEEACDIGRVEGDLSYADRAALCALVGGTWEQRSCMEMAPYVMSGMAASQSVCDAHHYARFCCSGEPAVPAPCECDGSCVTEPEEPQCVALSQETRNRLEANGWSPIQCGND
jgi:hypothetical protein